MAKYNKCTRTDCLHHKGSFGCHLLSQLYEDQNKCKFFCDRNKYYFTNKIYQGVNCTYISEIKGDQETMTDIAKRLYILSEQIEIVTDAICEIENACDDNSYTTEENDNDFVIDVENIREIIDDMKRRLDNEQRKV